jgi:hypothetical protein
MASYPEAQPMAPIYRLVVTASHLKAKQFVWVIVDDTNSDRPVQTSKATFGSLEDAYNAGRGALEFWRDKTRRTNPAVDLAQPPAKKTRDRVSGQGGPLTSSIYSRG